MGRNATRLATICLGAAVFLLVCAPTPVTAGAHLMDGLYCGTENCYDVLGIQRDTPRSELSKAYRRLAKQYHPDVQRGDAEDRAANEALFLRVANAYEILKDEESRNDYDYMLDNPDEYYAHYYRYYRRKGPKVDVRLVLFVAISIVSAIQYYSACQRYEEVKKHFLTVPKYRFRAMQLIEERARAANGGAAASKRDAGRSAKPSKSELRERTEEQIKQVIFENMDVKGAYAQPSIWDVLWLQLLVSPVTLCSYLFWLGSWTWRLRVCGQEYRREDKLYLIRRHLGMGVHQFASLEDEQVEEYLREELWLRDRFDEWKADEDDELARKMADNPRHKAYRRYMRNHGNGRMTFED